MAVRLVRSARQKDEDATAQRLAKEKPVSTRKKVEPCAGCDEKKAETVIGKKTVDTPTARSARGKED
jgi:hypothetical protein